MISSDLRLNKKLILMIYDVDDVIIMKIVKS